MFWRFARRAPDRSEWNSKSPEKFPFEEDKRAAGWSIRLLCDISLFRSLLRGDWTAPLYSRAQATAGDTNRILLDRLPARLSREFFQDFADRIQVDSNGAPMCLSLSPPLG